MENIMKFFLQFKYKQLLDVESRNLHDTNKPFLEKGVIVKNSGRDREDKEENKEKNRERGIEFIINDLNYAPEKLPN